MTTRTKKCKNCGTEYPLNEKYSAQQRMRSSYCSPRCSAEAKHKKALAKPPQKKTCAFCSCEYELNRKYNSMQRSQSKYCSPQCQHEAAKIKDGMSNQERHRRKRGRTKQGTPEFVERIRATTSAAMLRPEIQKKTHAPRASLVDAHKAKISDALVGKMPKNMMYGNRYPNIQSGHYENSKGTMFFRSKWEANYALFLDYLVKVGEIKLWEYEVDRFVFEQIQFGNRSYLPDFKIHNNDGTIEYHEVKGYMDGGSKTKLRRMEKYYPDIKLVLVDSQFYNDIKKKLGRTLNFY